MEKKDKKLLITGIIFVICFFLWILIIKTVDVKPVGVNNTDVGLASINMWFHNLTGTTLWLYNLTDILEVIPFMVCTFFGAIGFFQWVARKNMFKVDLDIISLGVYYIFVICAFFYFEFFPLNYRPILIEGKMESSFPSSTVLLVTSVMPTLILQANRRLKSIKAKTVIAIITDLYTAFMTVSRLCCGVHWLTDVMGGIILSIGLFSIYRCFVNVYCKNK